MDHPLGSTSTRNRSGSKVYQPQPQYGQSRPSLDRFTNEMQKEVAEAFASHRASPFGELSRADVKGKGRADDRIEVIEHVIQAQDSIMGVALKYGIKVPTLRKANKLWASDPIHLRKVLYIPLESCLRGNVIRGPETGQATVLPKGHHFHDKGTAAPSFQSQDDDQTSGQSEARQLPPQSSFATSRPVKPPIGEVVMIKKVHPVAIQGKPLAPRASADLLRPLERPTIDRSVSATWLEGSPLHEPLPSTASSSARPSFDLGQGSGRSHSRSSTGDEPEGSIEMGLRTSIDRPQLFTNGHQHHHHHHHSPAQAYTSTTSPATQREKSTISGYSPHSNTITQKRRPPNNLWFSVADDGIQPTQKLY